MQRPSANRFFAYVLIAVLVGSLFSVVSLAPPSFASHENITIDITDDIDEVYSPGDSVVIEGVIDDVQDNEDVTIRVLAPNGSEEEEDDVTPDEDDGYFDFLFEIPNNADGGVWTVEASYDGDEAFTYFMVEYDEDDVVVITVEVDASDRIYEANDDVTIEGRVEEVDDAEEFVRIIVLDPTNDELIDEDEVELGEGSLDDDEFEYEFPLDDVHGRYAVLVTYDVDDQEGAVLFEIEDEDAGSGGGSGGSSSGNGDSDSNGDLFAELDEETYEPGDTVTVSGIIEDYDDTEELEIVIEDPEGDEIESEDDVDVDEDGSDGEFEFEYDLEDDAEEGEYTVIVSYAGDEVELNFEVEGDGGSGGGGSSGFTVKLNKATYQAGETMTVSGTVEEVADPEDGELLSVFLYMPEGQVILAAGSSKYVTPSASGSWSTTVIVPSDLDPGNGYRVRVSYLEETEEATFTVSGVSSTPADEITVETDNDEYSIGDTVEITGEVPENLIESGQQLLIRVNKPDGNPCRLDPITLPSSGSFSYELVLGGVCGVAGEYEVEVTYGDDEASTAFELIGSSISTFNLTVESETYPIDYELSSGTINSMFVRPNDNKLVVTINAEQDGQVTLVLPRDVIDALEEGEDADFLVMVEDDSGNVSIADFEEVENDDEVRTLVIDYEAGTRRIEIAGTQVVPEFGAIVMIVMAVAIIGIIMTTTRYNKSFRQ